MREGSRRRKDYGYIYIAEAVGLHCVKIGYTGNYSGAEERIKACNTHCPAQVSLLCVLDGSPKGERWLHKKLAAFHIKGEWFVRTREIIAFIREIRRREKLHDYLPQSAWRQLLKGIRRRAKKRCWYPQKRIRKQTRLSLETRDRIKPQSRRISHDSSSPAA